jgi:ferrochelatase
MLAKLGGEGVKSLLVVPVAFVTDHIETLHEIDIELREIAEHAGIEKYEVMYALNDTPAFITALADVVEERYGESLQRTGSERRINA